jgi:hypothetical protein
MGVAALIRVACHDPNQGGAALQDNKTATTVRVNNGERVVTDGPFAQTREVLGSHYLIDAPDDAHDSAAQAARPYRGMRVRLILAGCRPQCRFRAPAWRSSANGHALCGM